MERRYCAFEWESVHKNKNSPQINPVSSIIQFWSNQLVLFFTALDSLILKLTLKHSIRGKKSQIISKNYMGEFTLPHTKIYILPQKAIVN